MAKVVISTLNPRTKKGRQAAGRNVKIKRIRDEKGKLIRVFSLDANDNSFGSKLRYVFGKSVAKARRENKKRFGAPDRVLARD
ncbi:MAG TPA: hypothetical protein VHD34_08890 [Xanthobacteraceae bacterium]|nr:hypothetical protein [Xanthobacteraceae bacterium]